MANCEMCGQEARVSEAIVEGSILKVCDKCSKFGEAIEIKRAPSRNVRAQRVSFENKKKPVFVNRAMESIVSGYGVKIRKARERMGMKQEQVAKAIAERESVVQKVESGNLEPTLKLAKKFEQFFSIKLVEKKTEEVKEEDMKEFNLRDGGLTIGDLLDLKK
ncbi:TIGR00270 family protein [archaeon]|jgi:putative transcription factor|nr:TIGR00270 family protein [archaeon]MBT4441413.1 TIGR00270 family protein [archaeon]